MSAFWSTGSPSPPRPRGRGVGTALIDTLCREAARRGYQAIRLEVIDANPRARALYEREGFIATRTDRLNSCALPSALTRRRR